MLGFLDSELSLAKYQPIKIQGFSIFLFLFFAVLLILLPTTFDISYKQELQSILTIPFSEGTQEDLSGAIKCFT